MEILTSKKLSGHPVSLAVLDFGLFTVHSNGRIIGIPGFLVTTSAGEKILIDTGFPEKYAEDLEKASLEDNLGEFGELLELTYENLCNQKSTFQRRTSFVQSILD
jgi:N-acyl homoserine lactone hydrolase